MTPFIIVALWQQPNPDRYECFAAATKTTKIFTDLLWGELRSEFEGEISQRALFSRHRLELAGGLHHTPACRSFALRPVLGLGSFCPTQHTYFKW